VVIPLGGVDRAWLELNNEVIDKSKYAIPERVAAPWAVSWRDDS
jgi:hypothetical protein